MDHHSKQNCPKNFPENVFNFRGADSGFNPFSESNASDIAGEKAEIVYSSKIPPSRSERTAFNVCKTHLVKQFTLILRDF